MVKKTETGASGGSGGPKVVSVGSGAETSVTYQVMRDMIEEKTAHLETKISSIESRIDQKLSDLPTLTQMVYVVAGIVSGALTIAVGTFIAVVSYGSGQFSSGSQFTASTFEQAKNAKDASDETKKLSVENAKQIGIILELLRRLPDKPPTQQK